MQTLKLLLILLITAACVQSAPITERSSDPGDLVKVTLDESKVGILLDEFPKTERDRVASIFLSKPEGWWIKRARFQFGHTYYKLAFTTSYYEDRQQMCLPMDEGAVDFKLTSKPARETIEGHDYVAVTYSVLTHVVASPGSAETSVPELATVGGKANITFSLPLDPYVLQQRTGNACMDEAGFPANSLDPESTRVYFDDTCTKDAYDPKQPCTTCHCTSEAEYDCAEALQKFVGASDVILWYERVAWNEPLAQKYESLNEYEYKEEAVGGDLLGYIEGMEHNLIIYRYFKDGSCERKECITETGWRKLILFDSIHVNVGSEQVLLGEIKYESGDPSSFNQSLYHNSYYWDPCHNHPHFAGYSTFEYAGSNFGHKQGFCIQATNRVINDRRTPMNSPFQTCNYQGVTEGWGDNYNVGIPCQWVDITDSASLAGPATLNLTQIGNPFNWLCEGQVIYDNSSAPEWQFSGNYTVAPPWPESNLPIDVYKCKTSPGALNDNVDNVPVFDPAPGNGLLTQECDGTSTQLGSQIYGPKRDCGFTPGDLFTSCGTPGQQVSWSCSLADKTAAPQVLRVCESSVALKTGTACRFLDDYTLANVIVTADAPVDVSFTCTKARDPKETGGYISWYTGALLNSVDKAANVTCVPKPPKCIDRPKAY
ncbi:hypothetical protein BJ742DRAFT_801150 [Cladochytrium replicatum]|nr:hypothetical protein BJ742DRAFT_801150 [Cladochytrium replicatum]